MTVFRSPDPKTNYIKRVVGFPNEDVRIQYGNLYAQKKDSNGEAVGRMEILQTDSEPA